MEFKKIFQKKAAVKIFAVGPVFLIKDLLTGDVFLCDEISHQELLDLLQRKRAEHGEETIKRRAEDPSWLCHYE